MLGLIRYFCGFVRIRVYGENPERIINHLNAFGISVWKIKHIGDFIELNIFINDYKKIMFVRHKVGLGVKIKLIGKCGFPFLSGKVLKRPGLLFGVAICFAVWFFLSQFIWLVDVEGNVKLKDGEILDVCSEFGVKIGALSNRLDTYGLPQKLTMKIDDIAWASFNVEGSKVTINVSEVIDQLMTEDKKPSNIIADFDGVIKKMEIASGKKIVQIGQVVAKGDLLVSGMIEYGENIHIVSSKGKIIAETRREFTEIIDKNFSISNGVQNVYKKRLLYFFGLKLPLYLNGVEGQSKSYRKTKKLTILGTDMPIGYIERVFISEDESGKSVSQDEAKSLALQSVTEGVRRLEIIEVISYDVTVTETSESYIIKVSLVSLEDIGKYAELLIVED